LSSTAVSSLPRTVAVESSGCWVSGYYCRSDTSNLVRSITSATAEECQAKCLAEDQCLFFSFHHTRGKGVCSLLSKCLVHTKCTTEESCATGQKICMCPVLSYLPGTKDSVEYARWKCGDVDPYSTTTPAGTTCSVSCPSWRDSTLQSTCLKNGKWSATEPLVGPPRALQYTASYPTPDQPDMECGCQDMGRYHYDPNDEDGAEFTCRGWESAQYKKPGGWSIKHGDRCDLYCSNEPEPVVSVYCEAARWRGEPGRGFWCYTQPGTPEPDQILKGCPGTWQMFDSHCYKFSEDHVTWSEAEGRCQEEGGHLTSIVSEEENQFLKKLGPNFWIGANDIDTEGDWVWNDGSALEFTHWDTEEPNDCCGGQDCGLVHDNGFWDDDSCLELRSFICKI